MDNIEKAWKSLFTQYGKLRPYQWCSEPRLEVSIGEFGEEGFTYHPSDDLRYVRKFASYVGIMSSVDLVVCRDIAIQTQREVARDLTVDCGFSGEDDLYDRLQEVASGQWCWKIPILQHARGEEYQELLFGGFCYLGALVDTGYFDVLRASTKYLSELYAERRARLSHFTKGLYLFDDWTELLKTLEYVEKEAEEMADKRANGILAWLEKQDFEALTSTQKEGIES